MAEVMLSGLIGIFLGDTALFATLNRLGPRRTSMLFSLNAPISAVLGYFFLAEVLNTSEILGICIVTTGVIIAIMFGKRRDQNHNWESVKGPLWIGVATGLLAATGQSVGSLIVSPILSDGADAIAVFLRAHRHRGLLPTNHRRTPHCRGKTSKPPQPTHHLNRSTIGLHRHGRRHDITAVRIIRRRSRYHLHPLLHHACVVIANPMDNHPRTPCRHGMGRCVVGGDRLVADFRGVVKRARLSSPIQSGISATNPCHKITTEV